LSKLIKFPKLFQALLVSDFGPKTAINIVESLRKEILAGNLKSGQEIKVTIII
jgi:fused signal recognition particle receptor